MLSTKTIRLIIGNIIGSFIYFLESVNSIQVLSHEVVDRIIMIAVFVVRGPEALRDQIILGMLLDRYVVFVRVSVWVWFCLRAVLYLIKCTSTRCCKCVWAMRSLRTLMLIEKKGFWGQTNHLITYTHIFFIKEISTIRAKKLDIFIWEPDFSHNRYSIAFYKY